MRSTTIYKNIIVPNDDKIEFESKPGFGGKLDTAFGETTFEEDGKPIIQIKTLDNLLIYTPTKEEFTTIMRILECSGRKDSRGKNPSENKKWDLSKETTEIQEGRHMNEKNYHIDVTCSFYTRSGNQRLISPELFYNVFNIDQKLIAVVNDYFDKKEK